MSNLEEREPEDSDSSDDEDYVPEGEVNDLSEESNSGEEEDGLQNSDNEAETGQKRKSRRKISRKSKKKAKVQDSDDSPKEDPATSSVKEEEVKKRAEDIWAAFKMDTGCFSSTTSKKEEAHQSDKIESSSKATVSKEEKAPSDIKKEEKKEEPKFFEFAGETHLLTGKSTLKPVQQVASPSLPTSGARRSQGGLADIMSQIKGKGTKLSTLEKSKMDWQNFKSEQGIDEEIQTHNRGKQGYLERQDFLERADLRRFEMEKKMRATTRRSNQ